MNNLEKYVNYVQPVVQAVAEHHMPFYRLQYFELSPDDLYINDDGLVEFMTQEKHSPEHFSGSLPMIHARWGEESGSCIILEIPPAQRCLLSRLVTDALRGMYGRECSRLSKLWDGNKDRVTYCALEFMHGEQHSGYDLSEVFSDFVGKGCGVGAGHVVDFVSRSLGLNYLDLENPNGHLEYVLSDY